MVIKIRWQQMATKSNSFERNIAFSEILLGTFAMKMLRIQRLISENTIELCKNYLSLKTPVLIKI